MKDYKFKFIGMISVCMTTYNGEKYLKQQIESILYQLQEGDELIISDDGSTDNTINIIESFQSDKIILLNHKSEGRIYKNFENSIINSKNEFILLSDQDDIWLENKLSYFKNALFDYDLVISNCSIINESNNIILPYFYTKYSTFQKSFLGNLYKNSYLGCCMGFRRNILNIILPFPRGIANHDWWIGLICKFSKKKILYIDKPLLLYRKHNNNNSCTHEESKYSLYQKLLWRIIIIIQILKRRLLCMKMKF